MHRFFYPGTVENALRARTKRPRVRAEPTHFKRFARALRDDPSLQGKVVLELTIAPGGEVSALRIVSSELKNAELENKLLARIRSFDFGAKDVDTMVVSWPVDFLPS